MKDLEYYMILQYTTIYVTDFLIVNLDVCYKTREDTKSE